MTFEFMEFDSMEAAFAYMNEQENAANANTAPEQRAITFGDYWIRFNLEPAYAIWGRVLTAEEVREAEERLADPDIPDEVEQIMASLTERYGRGYRYGWAFSIFEPDGELGDTHVYNVWPVTEEFFEAGKKVGWQTNELDEDGQAQMVAAFDAWRTHMLATLADKPLFRRESGDD